jgi:osmotically-inducible protein OsmY
MRTDSQLKNDVLEELKWAPALSEEDITVETHDGIVTLTGTVPHYADKWSAERVVQRVIGVKAIVEELEVRLHPSHKRKDVEIAEAVVKSLRWHVWVPSHVQATVENGWVTLSGNVPWEFQRNAAVQAVRWLSGVRGVNNNVTLTPTAEPAAIKESIEKALLRDAEIDAEHIQVSTSGSKVTLRGKVHSWDQREEARATAWSARGVTEVENDLEVAY